ncbi:MAG: signal peptidase I [Gemmatimonadetes bacterium]|nr:signal peptidase I [Gemmatimonadota bacterium]
MPETPLSDPPPVGAEPAYGPTPRRAGWRPLRALWEWMKSMATALLIFFIIRAFLVEAFKIPSGSMEGTLLVGDFLLVNKLVYGAEVPFTGTRLPAVHPPARGDVIVFRWPQDPTKDFVKRVVGLPGDTVGMVDGVLQRNGEAVREGYSSHTEPAVDPVAEEFRWQRRYLARRLRDAEPYRPSRNNWGPLVVPPSHLFVLGDNRDNSLDSRYWGFVPDSMVKGRPMLVYFSYSPDSVAPLPFLTNIRWGRLGTRIR